VQVTHRRIWFHVASHWPGRGLLVAAADAARQRINELHEVWRGLNLFSRSELRDPRDRPRIAFAPQPLK
jgi:hypothetical protein